MRLKINDYLKTARLWQWTKNFVVFTTPVGIGSIAVDVLIDVTISFLGISLISSATYVLNDLRDINIDKLHPIKKNRPIASGRLKKNQAVFFCLMLISLGLFLLMNLAINTFLYGFLYFIIGILYTTRIKFTPYLDMITISVLFIIRVLIGGSAVNIQPSTFLTLLIFFSSFCLALSKRISIYVDKNIPHDSEYKQFIITSYKLENLNKLFKFLSVLSITTYSFWVLIVKNNGRLDFSQIILLVSIVVLIRIFYGIYYLSNSSGLEDFVVSIYQKKTEMAYFVVMLFLILIGIYFG